MPSSVEELVELLDLEVIEDNLFRGRQPDTVMQRVFGGQVLAQSLVAAIRTVPDPFACHSMHSYFLRVAGSQEVGVHRVAGERVRNRAYGGHE